METEPAVFTGYFKDGEKRIDLMLVIQDDGNDVADRLRVEFLINVMKLGLELELEPGLMKEHRHLIFVKVHAPETVIEEQGENFRVRRHFKDSHVDFVNPGNKVIKFLRRFLPCIFNCYEKEWIKIVRRQYPGAMNYSTLERSLIVYRMLLVLPFGNRENYVGLNRLIKSKIILDAFALHDGPYFFIPEQNILEQVNARQILFANWVGGGNLLKSHPVSMIQEYLGERIAFYFAFTEFYIIALAIPAVAGNLFIYGGVYDGFKAIKERHYGGRTKLFDLYCHKTSTGCGFSYAMCPTCLDWTKCPFRRFAEVCSEFVFKSMITSSNLLKFYAILTLWGLLFILLWKRREYYFKWLWETDEEALKYTTRPEYKIPVKNLKRSATTGMWTDYESIFIRVTRIATNLIILGACVFGVFILTLFWANFQYDMVVNSPYEIQKIDVSLYYGIVKLTVLYAIMVLVFEKVTVALSPLMAQFENHRDQESYDRSVIGKMFLLTFIVTFWYLIFLAFVKGRLYTYPGDPDNFKSPGGIGMMHCVFPSCVDEVAVTVVIFAFVRFIIPKGIFYLMPITTDYSQGSNANIPIWEREYKMTPITEQGIREMFLELTMQFAFITMFSGTFSPISLFILIANIWDVRYKARLLLVGRRRPLLLKCSVIGPWLTWWEVTSYVAILSNAFMCAYNTRIVTEFIYKLLRNRGGLDFYEYLVLTYINDYFKNASSPVAEHYKHHKELGTCFPDVHCRYPGKYRRNGDGYEESMYVDYTKYYELLFVFVYELCFIAFILLLPFIFPAHPKDIEETINVENRIRTQCYIRRKRV